MSLKIKNTAILLLIPLVLMILLFPDWSVTWVFCFLCIIGFTGIGEAFTQVRGSIWPGFIYFGLALFVFPAGTNFIEFLRTVF